MIMRMFDYENLDEDFFDEPQSLPDETHPSQLKIVIDEAHQLLSPPGIVTPRASKARLRQSGENPNRN